LPKFAGDFRLCFSLVCICFDGVVSKGGHIMDDFTRANPTTSTGSAIGFVVAAVVVALVLLFVLFAGGPNGTTGDPAAVGAADESAPVLEETAPVAPATDG
jgi:hypothetical protein